MRAGSSPPPPTSTANRKRGLRRHFLFVGPHALATTPPQDDGMQRNPRRHSAGAAHEIPPSVLHGSSCLPCKPSVKQKGRHCLMSQPCPSPRVMMTHDTLPPTAGPRVRQAGAGAAPGGVLGAPAEQRGVEGAGEDRSRRGRQAGR